ncbi:hypothetical protein ACFJIX_20760 [Roseateles sp. UC29_93]|uniref:hypothetical protein n=1 Tax=Roseateles sp. UC29_93 TaxID=3350177 RepID=UPI000311FF9E
MSFEFETLRPVISGVLGGAAAMVFCAAVARWVPTVSNGKNAATLVRENRVAILVCNAIIFSGLLVGIGLYQTGIFAHNDWRGLALSVGGGSALGLLTLPLQALAARRNPREAYVAYAISQRTPIVVLYAILILVIVPAAVALSSLH